MGVYDDLVQYAEDIVTGIILAGKRTHRDHNMWSFIMLMDGISSYVVEYCGNGHNYQAVIDGFHKYYKKTKDETMVRDFQAALEKMAQASRTIECVQKTFSLVSYELRKEQEGSASFKADCVTILNKLYQTIQENITALEAERFDFDSWIREKSDYLRDTYGIQWNNRGF